MLLLPVAFCTPMHKHEYDLNIEWGANVIMCYNICDRDCSWVKVVTNSLQVDKNILVVREDLFYNRVIK